MKKLIVMAVVVALSTSVFARKPAPVQARFQQTVELAAELSAGSIGAEYIAGYRFNPYVFLGAGIGAHYGFNSIGQTELLTVEETPLRMHKLNIPLYVNLKAYFLKQTRCTPFVSVSAGGRFSTKGTAELIMGEAEYSTIGLLANAALGAEYRIAQNRSIHISVGAGMQSYPYARNIRSYQFDNAQEYKLNLDVRIGFTF